MEEKWLPPGSGGWDLVVLEGAAVSPSGLGHGKRRKTRAVAVDYRWTSWDMRLWARSSNFCNSRKQKSHGPKSAPGTENICLDGRSSPTGLP